MTETQRRATEQTKQAPRPHEARLQPVRQTLTPSQHNAAIPTSTPFAPTVTELKIMKTTRTLIAFAALAALGSSAFAQATITQSKALAGDVTPGDAAGYPITLSVPGHYQLKGNLSVPAGVNGIEITAANVTLDLNGFSLSGPVSCTRNASTRVVTCSGNGSTANIVGVSIVQPGAVLRNGTVQGFNGFGIQFAEGVSGRVEDLRSAQNQWHGITAAGQTMPVIVSRSSFELNGQDGVAMAGASIVDSSASFNGRDGFGDNCYTLVVNSIANGNARYGVNGVSAKGLLSRGNGAPRYLGCTMGGNWDGSTPW
jgi:hypothetical protein